MPYHRQESHPNTHFLMFLFQIMVLDVVSLHTRYVYALDFMERFCRDKWVDQECTHPIPCSFRVHCLMHYMPTTSFPSLFYSQKGLPESELVVRSPIELGGFKSDEYLAINPHGKVPALKCQTTGLCIAESDTVSRYLMSEYSHIGPSFLPDSPISNMIARYHDIYLQPIQTCLYKPGPPFGSIGSRKDALKAYSKQLYIISDLMDDAGPYMCGIDVSLADATVFPSIVFAAHMFPKMDSGIATSPIPPKIENWYNRILEIDSSFKKVYDEVSGL